MAKKKELSGWDVAYKWCYIFSIPLLLVSIIPVVPWRYKGTDPNFHGRFTMHRYVSLMSMSDKLGKMQPWSKWKRNMCQTMQIYMQPNLGGELLSLGNTLAKKVTGVSAPSTALGCQQWNLCKEQVTARCTAYNSIFFIGMATLILLIISAIMALSVPCILMSELKAKKKKDKEAAAMKAFAVGLLTFVLSAGMNVAWQFSTESEFRNLQGSAYYPVPHGFAGPYIAGAGSFFQGFGLLCRMWKQFGPKKSKDGDGDDQQDAGEEYAPAGYGYPPPPQDPGMPPALMGGAPPPPMIAQPGYGMPPPPPPM